VDRWDTAESSHVPIVIIGISTGPRFLSNFEKYTPSALEKGVGKQVTHGIPESAIA
jgi:hypothetical protein